MPKHKRDSGSGGGRNPLLLSGGGAPSLSNSSSPSFSGGSSGNAAQQQQQQLNRNQRGGMMGSPPLSTGAKFRLSSMLLKKPKKEENAKGAKNKTTNASSSSSEDSSKDSDDDDDDDDEEDEQKGGARQSGGKKVEKRKKQGGGGTEKLLSPREMHQFCKSVLEMCDTRELHHLGRKRASASFDVMFKPHMAQIQQRAVANKQSSSSSSGSGASSASKQQALKSDGSGGSQLANLDAIQHSFRTYLRTGSLLRNWPVESAMRRVVEHLEDAAVVELHPQFPKKPQTALNLYCRAKGYTPGLNCPREVLDKFQAGRGEGADDKEVAAAEKEAKQERKDYVGKLERFLREHRTELFPPQIDYVENKLKNVKKEKKAGASGGPTKRLTPFDIFMNSKKHKYTHLEPVAREEKLQRHFDKLDADKKAIFEDLAANQ